ncbi:Cytoplasmic polyadenylation element-binding protein [Trichinella pseudospiralis]
MLVWSFSKKKFFQKIARPWSDKQLDELFSLYRRERDWSKGFIVLRLAVMVGGRRFVIALSFSNKKLITSTFWWLFFFKIQITIINTTENQQYYIPVYSAANGVTFVPPPLVANMNLPYPAYPVQEPVPLHQYPPPISRPPLVSQERRQNQEPQQPVIQSAAVQRPERSRTSNPEEMSEPVSFNEPDFQSRKRKSIRSFLTPFEFLHQIGFYPQHKKYLSRKVLINGLAAHISKDDLHNLFSKYGKVIRIECKRWEREDGASAFVIFETEASAQTLLLDCTGDCGRYFMKCPEYAKILKIEIIPWFKENCAYFMPLMDLTGCSRMTVVCTNLPLPCKAAELSAALERRYLGIGAVRLDLDEFDYPTGCARLTFKDAVSYRKILDEVHLKLTMPSTNNHVIRIAPYFSNDTKCDMCKTAPKDAEYICTASTCITYMCECCLKASHPSGTENSHFEMTSVDGLPNRLDVRGGVGEDA